MTDQIRSRSSDGSLVIPETFRDWDPENLAALRGSVRPRIGTTPPEGIPSHVEAVAALAALAGLEPWEWQYEALRIALSYSPSTALFLYRFVVLLVARQNGKSRLLLLRILAGLFLFDEKIIHTAADRALPRALFEELVHAIEDVPVLRRNVEKIRFANGTEEIVMKGRASYRITAPRQEAARGWTIDLLVIDEAREQRDDAVLSAGLYTQRTRRNAQLWLASNAGDPDSVVLRRFRDRGIAAVEDPDSDPRMCLLEWSTDADPEDPMGWVEANPALGTAITPDALIEELRTDDPQRFRTEALCQWVETATQTAVPLDAWIRCGDPSMALTVPSPDDRVMMAVDVDPARLEAAIVIAVTKPDPDAKTIVGVAQRWVSEIGVDEDEIAAALSRWADLWSPEAIGYDPYTCSGLIERLEPDTYPTEPVAGVKWVNACAALWDVTVNESIVHASDPYLDAQIASAGRRDVGDGTFRIARLESHIALPGVMALARAIYLSLRPRRTFEIL